MHWSPSDSGRIRQLCPKRSVGEFFPRIRTDPVTLKLFWMARWPTERPPRRLAWFGTGAVQIFDPALEEHSAVMPLEQDVERIGWSRLEKLKGPFGFRLN